MRPVRILYVRHETVSVCALDFLYGFRRYRISIRAKMCVRVRAGIGAYQLNCPYARAARLGLLLARRGSHAHACVYATYQRDEVTSSEILGYEHWNYLKEHAYRF